MRNPLSGIDSCSALQLSALESLALATDNRNALSAEHISALNQAIDDGKHIQKCVKYIQSILNNALDMTKVADGRIDFQFQNVYIRAEVLDMALVMLSALRAEAVEVVVECDPRLCVTTDLLRLTQVVVNLLTNAFKFCRDGIVRITATLDSTTSLVQIAIEDSGPGIPAEYRHKLFSKYGQIDVRQGTGLGLALAKVRCCAVVLDACRLTAVQDLCAALGGRLFLCDDYSNGSRFVVELPGGSSLQPLVEVPVCQGFTPASVLPSRLAILLVDDSSAANRLLQRRLAAASEHTVITFAANGEEALRICDENSGAFDVVVIDENMQSTGGIKLGHEVVAHMRGALRMSRTAIFGCTGNALTCTNSFEESGADGVWSKPTPDVDSIVSSINIARHKRLGDVASLLSGSGRIVLVDDSVLNAKLLLRRISAYAKVYSLIQN